ncbi:MAG: DUF927 domain-containing protein, partial [Chloroflexi bacterium]|nr:DUF927 domain-containing protein [Chloroflexota bacterium]
EEIITESGNVSFRLQGKTILGEEIDTLIPAGDMEEQRVLKATLSAVSGPRGTIYPRMAQHLAPAIRMLTSDWKKTHRYERTGWADGTFLLPGREREGIQIVLPPKLAYRAHPAADLSLGLEALESLIRSVGVETSLPALVAFFQAPMAHLAKWRSERYGLFIQSRTGKFKTSWCQVALSLYGPEFASHDELLHKWGEGGTRNAIMNIATYLHDMPLLIDNFKPNTGDGVTGFVNLLHNILEGSDKERLDRNSKLRDSKPIYAWPIFTGEDVPDNDPASLARILLTRFQDQPEDAGYLLGQAQRNAEHLPAVGCSWLDFLESDEGIQCVQDALKEFEPLRDHYRDHLRRLRDDAVNIQRVATNLATNHITWQVLNQHPHIGPVLAPFSAEYEAGLQRIAAEMAHVTAECVAAIQWIRALRELVASGQGIIIDRSSKEYQHRDRKQDKDGSLGIRLEDHSVWLFPEITHKAIEQLLGPKALAGTSHNTLYKQLDDLGYIASKGTDGTLVPKNVYGTTARVLHLTRQAITGSGE